MPRALCLIRAQPHYRRWAFCKGLEKAGYSVTDQALDARPDDVLIVWNRYGSSEEHARRFEKVRATVLVCENGYLGRDAEHRQYYAIARGHHNGAGEWYVGGPERWAALGVTLAPWREKGSHILVCPSRGIGPNGVAMPLGWEKEVLRELRAKTARPIRVRPHPCDKPARVSLAEDLQDCHAAVVWNSAAGIHALVAGVPVIYQAPKWVAGEAASRAIGAIEAPPMPERVPAFERLAWAQWSIAEIESGAPFRYLLRPAGQGQIAASA